MECVYRAALTCKGENWYLRANSAGITPPEEAESQDRPGRAAAGVWQQQELSVSFQCFYRDILSGSGHATLIHCQMLVGANLSTIMFKGICPDKDS